MLGAVARGVDAAQHDIAERDLVTVLERVVRVHSVRQRVHLDRDACSSASRPCPAQVVRMRVCLDDADDPDLLPCRVLEVLLDCEGWIDHDRLTRSRIADEVGSTSEGVVDELREDHAAADRTSASRYFS